VTRLVEEFDLRTRELVAFVGAGGKTTTMFRLGAELQALDRRVVLTTTTRMGAHQHALGLVVFPDPQEPRKVIGPGVDTIEAMFANTAEVDYVLVEADGANHRTVKAPAPYEPVVPASTTLVVCVIGAGALNRVIEDQAHRPMRVAAAARCSPYDRLTPRRAAAVVASDIGGRKAVPASSRFVVVITNVGAKTVDAVAEMRKVLRNDYDVKSVTVEPIADA
jgi:probable selenium-dependent hydroxylase accessory protein YqeC